MAQTSVSRRLASQGTVRDAFELLSKTSGAFGRDAIAAPQRCGPINFVHDTKPPSAYGTAMRPNIFPVLRYDNAPAAIEFLVAAFGFAAASDYRSPEGGVLHADLRFGPSVVGISSTGSSAADSPWANVRQGIYIAVGNADSAYQRARSAGAEIAMPIADQSYGSRDFTLRDPEGHLWGFGTYVMDRGDGAPTIFPEVLYRDVRKAINWMETAMGFTRGLVVPADDGTVKHAELRLQDGVVFVGSAPQSGPFRGVTHFSNLRVDDPDAHHQHAKAAGATIVMEPQTAPFGARFYAARDPEEGLWWISNYHPA
jgi:uncharacterized glyoxalase superfamily protein PhnB